MPSRRADTEAYIAATALARAVRAGVAEQLAELLREGDQTGSGEKLRKRIEGVMAVRQDILEARGRQDRNALEGLPVAPAVRDEIEAVEALRSAVMMVAVAAGEWVAAMDYEQRRRELTLANGQRRRPRPEEEI